MTKKDQKKIEKKFSDRLNSPIYDNVGLSINRMGLSFDEYVKLYPKILKAYKQKTDGDEAIFIQEEYTIFDEVMQIVEQEYTEEGIDKRSWLWDIRESYYPYLKRINSVVFLNIELFENSNNRKKKFLVERAKEINIEIAGIPVLLTDNNLTVDLKKSLLLLHYLDKFGHIKFTKIHPDKNHLSEILAFIIGKSKNTIYQNISPAGIIKMKETKGVLESVLNLLSPMKSDFPELLEEIQKDIKKLPF